MICLHCHKEVNRNDAKIPESDGGGQGGINRCPHCNAPGLYRGRTNLGSVVYFHGVWAGCVDTSIHYDHYTPDELRLIADDLEAQEKEGNLFYPDGSGDGMAGRKEAR